MTVQKKFNHLDYYIKNKISPVRQNIKKKISHFERRDSLYKYLGITKKFINKSEILEVGPAEGHNAAYLASCDPKKLDLVEANYKHLPILGLWDVCVDLSTVIGEKQGLLSEYQHTVGSSWINVNSSKYDHNIHHCHPGTYLACVYYVKCDKDSGNLVFSDPRPGNATNIPHADNLTVYNSVEINIEPEQGELVLFPGWLYHHVTSNQNNQNRN